MGGEAFSFMQLLTFTVGRKVERSGGSAGWSVTAEEEFR